MPINTNALEFQKSITQELDSVKNRVRSLIGSAHWGEDGRYKEVILKNVLKRFLPQNISVGTGFVVNGRTNEQQTISKQIDIIIYDNTYPLLFQEGDFIIASNDNVKGLIEVKSKINNKTHFKDILANFDESIKNIFKPQQEAKLFLGIFSYESDINCHSLQEILIHNYKTNHISLGTNYFIKKWKNTDRICEGMNTCENPQDFYSIYDIYNLSYSYFISNAICQINNLKEKGWFYFPIKDTKEIYKIASIDICQ